MSKRKYRAQYQIDSVTEFDECPNTFFIVQFGETRKTLHRSFLISWQYRTLENFIKQGRICAACPMERNDRREDNEK